MPNFAVRLVRRGYSGVLWSKLLLMGHTLSDLNIMCSVADRFSTSRPGGPGYILLHHQQRRVVCSIVESFIARL